MLQGLYAINLLFEYLNMKKGPKRQESFTTDELNVVVSVKTQFKGRIQFLLR